MDISCLRLQQCVMRSYLMGKSTPQAGKYDMTCIGMLPLLMRCKMEDLKHTGASLLSKTKPARLRRLNLNVYVAACMFHTHLQAKCLMHSNSIVYACEFLKRGTQPATSVLRALQHLCIDRITKLVRFYWRVSADKPDGTVSPTQSRLSAGLRLANDYLHMTQCL